MSNPFEEESDAAKAAFEQGEEQAEALKRSGGDVELKKSGGDVEFSGGDVESTGGESEDSGGDVESEPEGDGV
ncbi:hypothetical protein AB0E69_29315 [Kribbella sp. NPDC026611]|uniref:hypothetical protein n=1 Tax=Kribbella sp. NPDC026611 TaxID=3154911 RepID=UPI0033D1A6F9